MLPGQAILHVENYPHPTPTPTPTPTPIPTPDQAILHVEIWDYTLLKESLIGGTTIDLEDRYYSQKWKEMQAMQKMPRELRQLRNETSTNVQGNIILKVEVFPVAFARANPMEHLAPPKKTQVRTGGNHRPYPQL